MKKILCYFFLFVGICLFVGTALNASYEAQTQSPIPYSLDAYEDDSMQGIWSVLLHRIKKEPFNAVATLIFFLAVVHTFLASRIAMLGKKYQKEHEDWLKRNPDVSPENVCYKAEILHFFGEVEAIFGIWIVPLIFAIIAFHGWHAVVLYIDTKVVYTEPMFVVIIMIIASTRPVILFAKKCLQKVAAIGKHSPAAWWFSILTIGPLLGSFITEPAAMTISALLLGQQIYELRPSRFFKYATLGLLFVNISVGGTLTHFAAPPILMVANVWDWNIKFTLVNFGWKALIGIIVSNLIYYFLLRKEFKSLKERSDAYAKTRKEFAVSDHSTEPSVPLIITLTHIFFLAWTVFNLHHVALFMGGFLFFLAFTRVTLHHQYRLSIRVPLLVGFFLAGLVTHGSLQQWWIEPVLSALSEVPLFIGSTVLTAFNDNAAITFLASLVPEFANNVDLQKAVVEGAVAGGGLTIIANAPNPAGQSILSKHFEEGISPLKLLFGALTPTIVLSCCFMLLP